MIFLYVSCNSYAMLWLLSTRVPYPNKHIYEQKILKSKNSSFLLFFSAIHQKLESDGTEKVEGSMTQRLENILNSKT